MLPEEVTQLDKASKPVPVYPYYLPAMD
jgi:hypothetical protein